MGIKSATESLKGFGQLVLKEEHKDKFNDIKEPEVHHSEFREKIKSDLEIAQKHGGTSTEEDIKMVDKELKLHKISIFSEYLCDLTECLLKEMQQSQAAYYSKGRTDKKDNEGNIVKSAARAILALDKLCRLCDLEDDVKFEKELNSFLSSLASKKKDDDSTEEDHVIRYGLNILNKDEVKLTGDDEEDKKANKTATSKAARKTEQFEAKIKAVTNIGEKKQILMEARDKLLLNPDKISGFIGDLFDYRRQTTFNLKESVTLTDNQKKKTVPERKKFRQEAIKKYFDLEEREADDYNFIFEQDDEGDDIVTIVRKNNIKLAETLDKHLNIVWAAFPNLANHLMQVHKKEQVEDLFLSNEVLDKQGWSEAKYRDEATRANISLTVDYLKQEILDVKQRQLQQLSRVVIHERK